MLSEYTEGLRFLAAHKDVFLTALHKAMLMLFFGSTFHVVQVAIAETVLVLGQEGSLGVGLMFAAVGLGTGVSPLVARAYTGDRDRPMRMAILVGYGLGTLGLIVVSFLSGWTSVLTGALIVGFGNGLLWVFSTQLLLHQAPEQIRGRVMASEFAFFALASAVGSGIAGAALDHALGIAGILRWMAVLSIGPAVVWGLWLSASRSPDGSI
jgi:MFS family permease